MSVPLVPGASTIAEERPEIGEAAEGVFREHGVDVRRLPAPTSEKFPTYASKVTGSNKEEVERAYTAACRAANRVAKKLKTVGKKPYWVSETDGYVYMADAYLHTVPVDDSKYEAGVEVKR